MTDKINAKLIAKLGGNTAFIALSGAFLSVLSIALFLALGWELAPYYFNSTIQTGTVENITAESHTEYIYRRATKYRARETIIKEFNGYVFHINDGRSLQRIPVPDESMRRTRDGWEPVINPEWRRTDDNWTDENTVWEKSASSNWEWVRIHTPTGRVMSTAKQEWESIIRAIDREMYAGLQELRNRAENYVTKPQTTNVKLRRNGRDSVNYEHLIGKTIEYKSHIYFYQMYYTTRTQTSTEEFVEIKHNGEVIYSNPKKQHFINC